MQHFSDNIHTDRHLVARVLAGDNPGFAIIIKKTEALVAQIVFKMISNSEDRRDLAQDIYLKVFRNLPGFKFQSKLSTWIARIAYNSCLDHLEKKKLVLSDNLYDEPATGEDAVTIGQNISSANEPESLLFQKQKSEILQAEIEKLSPVYKTLITLFHNEELSYQEIMEITGLPDGTVKNYLFRARKILKNALLLTYKKEDL